MKLVLFFTQGVSLRSWSSVGILEREAALYHKLVERGVEVEFVTYGDQQDLALGAELHGISLRVNDGRLQLPAYERSLAEQPPAADVYKSNQVAGAEAALEAARRAGAKFIARCGYLLSEFHENRYGERSREAKAARKLEQTVFEGADWVTVTTERMAGAVAERYGIPAAKIGVIPNYVETDRFRPQERTRRDRLRVVFVGRLDTQKNLHNFIRAAADFDIEVWLVGYGPQKDELERFAEGTKARFEFKGNVSNRELPGLLNQCDVFVLPSLYEGHPKTLLEAMACGLPTLGTRVNGIQEIIRDGQNGLLCQTSAAGIRSGLERLLGDSELRQRLGQAGRDFVQAEFALERVVKLELELLNRFSQ